MTKNFSIGKTIATLRKTKGWTQVELAEKLNVSDKAISKWESEAGFPEISQFPELAKVFDVTIDYLMTGNSHEQISLDDMDETKRMFYLIKKDDAENYVKYDYPKKTFFDDFNVKNSAILSIIENKSSKIFNTCVKNGIQVKKSKNDGYTLVGAMYEHIDDLIQMACDSGCLDFFKTIDFLSFAVGDKTQQLRLNNSIKYFRTYHTYDPKTAYLVSPQAFEYIFTSPAASDEIIEYISTYRAFDPHSIQYNTTVGCRGIINGVFYFLEQNIIEQLYKTKRFDLLSNYINQIRLDTMDTIKKGSESSSSDRYYGISYRFEHGYHLHCNSNSYGMTTVLGKIITIDKKIIDLAISNLDEHWTDIFVNYNRNIVENCPKYILSIINKSIFVPDSHELDLLFDEAKRQKRIKKIKEDPTLNDKHRRQLLFDENALSISDILFADDYDLFAKLPEEKTSKITVRDIVATDCKDIRFYIHVVNVDENKKNLNYALKSVLEKYPDRYDIIDVLLSAGAVIDDNLAFTNILKQNVSLYFSNKETTPTTDIGVDKNISKESLLKSLSEGKLEYVIVNLTIVLEQKLKAKLSEQNMDLIDMIDKIYSMQIINDFECKMLHNLRKARNGIMHQSGKFYYTEPIITTWIRIVYSF